MPADRNERSLYTVGIRIANRVSERVSERELRPHRIKSVREENEMRRIILGMIILIMTNGAALAQTSGSDRKAWGYFVGGVGATSGNGSSTATFQVAGGGEGLVYKGAGTRRGSRIPGAVPRPGRGLRNSLGESVLSFSQRIFIGKAGAVCDRRSLAWVSQRIERAAETLAAAFSIG